jgi:hypothetical protein
MADIMQAEQMPNQKWNVSADNFPSPVVRRANRESLAVEPEAEKAGALSRVVYTDRIRDLAEKERLLKGMRTLLQQTLGLFGLKLEVGNQEDQRLSVDQELRLQNFVGGALQALEEEQARREAFTGREVHRLDVELDVNKQAQQHNRAARGLHAGVATLASAYETGMQQAAVLQKREESISELAGKAAVTAQNLHADLAVQYTPQFPAWFPVPKAITNYFEDRADKKAAKDLQAICAMTANPRLNRHEVRKFRESKDYQACMSAGYKGPLNSALDVYVAKMHLRGIEPGASFKAYQQIAGQLKQQGSSIDREQIKRADAIVRDPLAVANHQAVSEIARANYAAQASGDIASIIEGQKNWRTIFRNKDNPLEIAIITLQGRIASDPKALEGFSEKSRAVLESVQGGDWRALGEQLKDKDIRAAFMADAAKLQEKSQRLQEKGEALKAEKTAVTNGLDAFRVGVKNVMRQFALCFEIDKQTGYVKRTASLEEVVNAVGNAQRLYTSSTTSGPVFAPFMKINDAIGSAQEALSGVTRKTLKGINAIVKFNRPAAGQQPDELAGVQAYQASLGRD